MVMLVLVQLSNSMLLSKIPPTEAEPPFRHVTMAEISLSEISTDTSWAAASTLAIHCDRESKRLASFLPGSWCFVTAAAEHGRQPAEAVGSGPPAAFPSATCRIR
jgi:hypothetical protein